MSQGEDGAVKVLGLVMAVAAYFAWPHLTRLTADARVEPTALWVWATDPTPGATLHARVRIDGGQRTAITGVTVHIADADQHIAGESKSWDGTITEDRFDNADATLDFTFVIPATLAVGAQVPLRFEVETVTAVRDVLSHTYTDDERTSTLAGPTVTLIAPTMSTVRRVGRGVLAIVSWLLVAFGLVKVRDRMRAPSALWWILALPYAVLSVVWFYPLLGGALRMHGWYVIVLSIAAWMAALVLFAHRTRHRYLPQFTLLPAFETTDDIDPYRTNQAPTRAPVPLIELVSALTGRGMNCIERPGELEITTRTGTAVLSVPTSGVIAGEPLTLRCADRNETFDIVEACASVLGSLRCPELRAMPFEPARTSS